MPGVHRSEEPFYHSGDPKLTPSRRILLLSPHFPPGQAAGALRWQKLARFAADRGWGTAVLPLDPASLPAMDSSRLADLPAGVRVYGIPPQRPMIDHLEKLLLGLRA